MELGAEGVLQLRFSSIRAAAYRSAVFSTTLCWPFWRISSSSICLYYSGSNKFWLSLYLQMEHRSQLKMISIVSLAPATCRVKLQPQWRQSSSSTRAIFPTKPDMTIVVILIIASRWIILPIISWLQSLLCCDFGLHSWSGSESPSAYKFEVDNDATNFRGCGTVGDTQTGKAVKGLVTVVPLSWWHLPVPFQHQ